MATGLPNHLPPDRSKRSAPAQDLLELPPGPAREILIARPLTEMKLLEIDRPVLVV
jgi:hypothetical protein